MDEEKNKLSFLDVLVECCSFTFVTSIYRKPVWIWVGMLLLLSLGRLTWSSVSHSGLLSFVRISLKVNLNRLKISFWVIGILRKSLLTPLTKLFISLGITSGHFDLLNGQFILDFFGLNLLVSWLPIRFLPLLHAVLVRLRVEPSLLHKLHFTLFIRMWSSSNKAI